MQSFPEKRKGPTENLASAFCSAARFLSEENRWDKGWDSSFLRSPDCCPDAYNLFPTLMILYLLIIGGIAGQIAHFLVCKRKGLGDYLLETGLRYGGMAVGWWISIPSWASFSSFFRYDWALRGRRNICPVPQVVSQSMTFGPRVGTFLIGKCISQMERANSSHSSIRTQCRHNGTNGRHIRVWTESLPDGGKFPTCTPA